MAKKRQKWFVNVVNPDVNQQIAVRNTIYSGRSKFQSIEVIDSSGFGKCLILDDKIQSSELDEFIYHEALVHPALILHPNPRAVLIAGGGEGGVLREVLAYKNVESVTMVDIDEEVVRVAERLLPSWHQGAFQDKRVKLLFADARKHLAENSERFDVIICDLSDPVSEGPSRLLFTAEFYEIVRSRLTEDGIVSIQAESPSLLCSPPFLAIINTLKSVFGIVAPYCADVPSFGSTWGFALASQNMDPMKLTIEQVDQRISDRINKRLGFYDGVTHQAIFSLPKYLRQRMEEEKTVVRDDKPLTV